MIVTVLLGVAAGLIAFELWGSVESVGKLALKFVTAPLGEPQRALRRAELAPLVRPCAGERRITALCRLIATACVLVAVDVRHGRIRHPIPPTFDAKVLIPWIGVTENVFDWVFGGGYYDPSISSRARAKELLEWLTGIFGSIAVVGALAILFEPGFWPAVLVVSGAGYLGASIVKRRLALEVPLAICIVTPLIALAVLAALAELMALVVSVPVRMRRTGRKSGN